MHPATCHTRFRTLLKAVASDDTFSVRAVLSLPVKDLAGDVVIPEGLDFAPHQADPWVDLEHGFEPSVGRQAVGWARKSLALPGGDYSVQKALLDVPGAGRHTLPVGTTYFDRDHALQRQVYHLVKSGALPGVSLEFQPDWSVAKAIGPRLISDGPKEAYEYPAARVRRWTHCVEPVCPGALTVLKSLPPELDALAKALRDETAAGETLHPYILKSLARYKPTATMIRVEKAMPAATAEPETVYDPTPDEAGSASGAVGEAPAKPTAAAHYNCAGNILAAIEQAEADLEASEHLKGKKFLMARLEKLLAEAEAIKAMGDKIDAETAEDAEDEDGAPDAEGEPEDPDMETDEEGAFKAVRPPYRLIQKAVRGVKRYSLAEVQQGIEAAAQDAKQDAKRVAAQAPAEDEAERTAAAAEVEKARKRLKRTLANCT